MVYYNTYGLTWCITIILLSSDIEINPGPKSSSREYFSICHWNLNSSELYSSICVSETFLNSETAPNDPNLEIIGYNMYPLFILPIAKEEVYVFCTKQRFL